MKRRRNLLVALLLVCAMGIGVGYAALSADLTMTGTTTVEAQPMQVVISQFADSNNLDTFVIGDVQNVGTANVTFDVTGLVNPGDAVVANVTIRNDNDAKVTLTALNIGAADHDGNNYFSVTTNFVANQTLEAKNDGNTDDEYNFTVTITLNKVWVGETALESSFTLTTTAELVDPNTP